jgi:hypothetical protein
MLRVACLCRRLLGVLVGWFLDPPAQKSVLPGFVTMNANTAGGFILVGRSRAFPGRTPRSEPAQRLPSVGGWAP